MIAEDSCPTALPDDVPLTKRCTKCGEVKEISEFHINKKVKDGRHNSCKECRSRQKYVPVVEGTKVCSRCYIEKPVSNFYASPSTRDGLRGECKQCRKILDKASRPFRKKHEPMESGSRICTCCGEKKSIDNFSLEVHCIGGYNTQCRNCIRVKAHARINNNPYRPWALLSICRHKRRGMTVLVSKEDLGRIAEITTHCHICKCKLNYESGTKGCIRPDSPSWDRIYNGKRMTLDNTWIICNRCNRTKSDLPMPEFVAYCKMVADKFGGEYL